jgi:hypothetical protein
MRESKFPSFLHRFWIREAAVYLAAFFIFTLILLNRSPNLLRPLSMNLQFGFTWVIPLLFIVLYLAFSIPGWPGSLIGLTATLALFALALAGIWASGHTQSVYISGLIPLRDAQFYYVDALRLLAGRNISEFSAARPLFAGLLATILAITGRDLMIALMALTAINGLACFFAATEIRRTHGTLASVFLLIFLFLYYRYRTVGSVMSENIGLALSIIAVTLLWRGITTNSFKLVLYALFINTLALNARPGPFFVLPALLLWASWYYRKPNHRFSWHFLLLGLLAIAAGFGASLLIKQFFGASSGVLFSQFSYALYGLASGGKSWSYIFQVHPELSEMSHPELISTAYELTFDLIKHNPVLLLQGALHNWSILFSNSWYNLFSYVSGENSYVNSITRWSLYILCILGLIRWIQKITDPYMSCIVAATAGILLSVPFVPPADAYGMRLYAASIIFIGMLPTLGLAFLAEKLKVNFKPVVDKTNSQTVVWFSAFLTLVLLMGPFLVHGTSYISQVTAAPCQDDMTYIIVVFDSGNSIQIVREKDPGLDWLPRFHYGIFKRNVHGLPDTNLIDWLENVEPGTTLFYTFDYHSNREALVVIPTSKLPRLGSIMKLCGQWQSDPAVKTYSIFVSEDATIISE